MIYQSAVRREFAQTALAVFISLLAILLTTQLIRLLGQAAGGKISPESVMALLGFAALNYLPILMSLTLFIAVLLSLSRAYRDSEMVVWFSSGLSLAAWIRPVLRFAAPLLVCIAALSLFLSPWAMSKSAEYRLRMDQRDDVSRVTPGAFKESAGGDKVFFVDAISSESERIKNVFVSSIREGRLGVMVAATGHTETAANGDSFVVLENGRRYEGKPGTTEYRVMEFERYGIRTETKEAKGLDESPRYMSSRHLLSNPTPANLGELVWRFGIPLAALNLVLLAIPLSFVNPRAGRANNLIFAILTYMIYNNLLSVSQAWVASSKLSFEFGVWGVHVFMFVLLILLFWRRISIGTLGRFWR